MYSLILANAMLFLSTLSLRRATCIRARAKSDRQFLSTLSLRRATRKRPKHQMQTQYFYPRSPCGERPVTRVARTPTTVISIHALLAESDRPRQIIIVVIDNFYPRSPCGERQAADISVKREASISIHALLAESDTHTNKTNGGTHHISIHALLAESDVTFLFYNNQCQDFYPRSPCGERQMLFRQSAQKAIFLSTLSLRRATWLFAWIT